MRPPGWCIHAGTLNTVTDHVSKVAAPYRCGRTLSPHTASMAFADPARSNLMSRVGRPSGLARRYQVQLFFSCLMVHSVSRTRRQPGVSAHRLHRVLLPGARSAADRVPTRRRSPRSRHTEGSCRSPTGPHRAPRGAAAPRARVHTALRVVPPRRHWSQSPWSMQRGSSSSSRPRAPRLADMRGALRSLGRCRGWVSSVTGVLTGARRRTRGRASRTRSGTSQGNCRSPFEDSG